MARTDSMGIRSDSPLAKADRVSDRRRRRDEFAMAALTGLISLSPELPHKLHPPDIVVAAYEFADAMDVARSRRSVSDEPEADDDTAEPLEVAVVVSKANELAVNARELLDVLNSVSLNKSDQLKLANAVGSVSASIHKVRNALADAEFTHED